MRFAIPAPDTYRRRTGVLLMAAAAVAGTALLFPTGGCGPGQALIDQAREKDDLERTTGTTPTRVIQVLQQTDGSPVIADVTAPEGLRASRLPTGGATRYADLNPGDVGVTLTDSQNADQTVAQVTAEKVGTPTEYKTLQTRTVLIFGTPGASTPDGPQPLVVSDPKLPTDLGDTFAAVRVVSVAPDLGPVDLYTGDQPVIGVTRITFRNPTPYRRVEAGDAKLSLRPATFATPTPVPTPTPTPTPTPDAAPSPTPTPSPTPDPPLLGLSNLARGTRLQPGRSYTIIVYGRTGVGLDAVMLPE